MTVKLTFTGDKTEVAQSEAEIVLGEVLSLHDTTSSTSGTYKAENQSIQPTRDGDGYNVHIGLSLIDADDSDYPHVKDDLAEQIAGLSIDFGTKDEVKDKLTGSVQ
jgi:hypothetical protein